jgi:hypothetical protein
VAELSGHPELESAYLGASVKRADADEGEVKG